MNCNAYCTVYITVQCTVWEDMLGKECSKWDIHGVKLACSVRYAVVWSLQCARYVAAALCERMLFAQRFVYGMCHMFSVHHAKCEG